MATSFLLRFNTMANADIVLANTNYATSEVRNEETQFLDVPINGSLNNTAISTTESFQFLASQVKALTTPHTITRSIPYDILGLSGNRNMDFVVDNVTTFTRKRENWIGFTVNGERYFAKDDGGTELVPTQGIEIWDFDGQNGWPLMNIKAVYDQYGNQTTAPQKVPGVFVVLRFVGEDQILADQRQNPLDETLWETSILANNFKTNGTEQTYTRTGAQTDWGTGYTVTYYEITIGGVLVGMVDPNSLPTELLAQHGIVRTTVV